jgi:hypothetical protein
MGPRLSPNFPAGQPSGQCADVQAFVSEGLKIHQALLKLDDQGRTLPQHLARRLWQAGFFDF